MRTFALALFLSLSCAHEPTGFDRSKFENYWWGFEQFPVCFNFHETGDLLIYETRIRSEGPWDYCEPNQYTFLNGEEIITVHEDEECWEINGLSLASSLTACECIQRQSRIVVEKVK